MKQYFNIIYINVVVRYLVSPHSFHTRVPPPRGTPLHLPTPFHGPLQAAIHCFPPNKFPISL